MKPTKERKDKAIEDLSLTFGSVELMCDGHKVHLRVERGNGLTYRVMTYVDGWFHGKWCDGKTEYPEQKFLNRRIVKACSAKTKAEHEKILGKRAIQKNPYYSATFTIYKPDWASGKAAINHLCKVCESVEIVKIGYGE